MKYAYEDLSDDQFEKLVVAICQEILGISVQGFAKGPDGGRDAKFIGKAELHPSKADPWTGVTIIQAKHTNGINRSFSELDFFNINSSNTILGKEIHRIRRLHENGQLDNYMLFTNRRLTGNSENKIHSFLSKECNIREYSLYLCGLEQLEMWLNKFSNIPKQVELDPVDSPLIISPDDLSEIVESLSSEANEIKKMIEKPPTPRVPYEDKNRINNMSLSYAKEQRKRYLKDVYQIHNFLAAPENLDLLNKYNSVIEEFQFKILSKRKNYQTFDEILEYIIDLLFNRNVVLRRNKKLTRTILFYMYWICDIGEVDDVKTL